MDSANRSAPSHDHHDHDHGLAHDLDALIAQRRRALRWLGVGAVTPIALWGCGGGGSDSTSTTTTTGTTGTTGTTTTTTTTSCAVIPEETAGPYPGDGSNSNSSGVVNALALSGIVRSDIRSSIAGASGTAAGVPMTVKLKLVGTASGCASLAGYAVYLWHCTRDGLYSLYSSGVTNQNYLRGVQAADSDGVVTFTTIFPGCYDGRMPHNHFEVFRSVDVATSASGKIKTSQLGFPVATLNQAYATAGYESSVLNLTRISYATDNVFSDGTSLQIATMTGDAVNGYVATLQVGVAA